MQLQHCGVAALRVVFRSPAELQESLKFAGVQVEVTQLEQGRMHGQMDVRPMDVGAVLRLQANRTFHAYGERRALPFTMVEGEQMNFQGTESIAGHLGGWNPSVQCTNALVRPGSVFNAWLMPPEHVIGAMAGNDQVLEAFHTTNLVEMPEAGARALLSLYEAALAGGPAKAEDVLIEFQSAVLGGGETLDFDPDDRTALVRAVDHVMNNLHADMDGRDLAEAALTHEGNLRKHFSRYGTSPMAFKRYAELCHLGRFARTEEGTADDTAAVSRSVWVRQIQVHG